jgi:hypothetical protein
MEPTEERPLPEGSRSICELRPGERDLLLKVLEEFKNWPRWNWENFSPDLSGLGVKKEEPGASTWWKTQTVGSGLAVEGGESLGLTWRQLFVLLDAFAACYAGHPEDKFCMLPPLGCFGAFAEDVDLEVHDLLPTFALSGALVRWIERDRQDRPFHERPPGIPGHEVWLALKYLSEHASCMGLASPRAGPKSN